MCSTMTRHHMGFLSLPSPLFLSFSLTRRVIAAAIIRLHVPVLPHHACLSQQVCLISLHDRKKSRRGGGRGGERESSPTHIALGLQHYKAGL